VLGQRAGHLAGDRRDDVAGAVGRQLRAQDHRAAAEVAAQPRGPADDVARLDVRSRAQVLEERAADVLLDLLLGLLDGDVGERGDGGEVQELARLGHRGRGADERDDAEQVVAALDRRLGAHRVGDRRGTPPRPLSDIPAQGRQGGGRRAAARRRHRHVMSRDDDGDRSVDGRRCQLGHPLEPLAAQHGVHHLEVDGP
jgi:hypothetical protein